MFMRDCKSVIKLMLSHPITHHVTITPLQSNYSLNHFYKIITKVNQWKTNNQN